jgi:hypothetical protein
MKSEIAKYKLITESDCDICRGYYDTIYEFTYTTKKPGENIVSIEKCRFCHECLENVKKEFGDHESI